jgi:hypothetical protein
MREGAEGTSDDPWQSRAQGVPPDAVVLLWKHWNPPRCYSHASMAERAT